jgi:hypothetical protein
MSTEPIQMGQYERAVQRALFAGDCDAPVHLFNQMFFFKWGQGFDCFLAT